MPALIAKKGTDMPQTRIELTSDDGRYPDALKASDVMTNPTLYLVGDPEALSGPKVAVIGTRRSTPYGIACAEMAGRLVAELGLTLVTGATLGCGAAAARAASDAGARLLVMTATSADMHYPESSKDVFESAKEKQGVIVSLEGWNTPPIPANFARKNEAMARLADVVVVCEAAAMSGVARIAATALDLHKPVLAFPGSVFSPGSAGANALIADGARIILSESTLREELSKEFGIPTGRVRRVYRQVVRREPDDMLEALRAQPMCVADIARALGHQTTDVLAELARREMDGQVVRLPSGEYSLSEERYRVFS